MEGSKHLRFNWIMDWSYVCPVYSYMEVKNSGQDRNISISEGVVILLFKDFPFWCQKLLTGSWHQVKRPMEEYHKPLRKIIAFIIQLYETWSLDKWKAPYSKLGIISLCLRIIIIIVIYLFFLLSNIWIIYSVDVFCMSRKSRVIYFKKMYKYGFNLIFKT